MCIHSYDSSDETFTADVAEVTDQKAWSLVARMPNGSTQRFAAGVVRRDDGRLVVSLLNLDPKHADVGLVQWLGSEDPDDASHALDYAVTFAERVVSEYEKPAKPVDQLLEFLSGGRPSFFVRADEAYPGFEPVDSDVEYAQQTPDGFGSAE